MLSLLLLLATGAQHSARVGCVGWAGVQGARAIAGGDAVLRRASISHANWRRGGVDPVGGGAAERTRREGGDSRESVSALSRKRVPRRRASPAWDDSRRVRAWDTTQRHQHAPGAAVSSDRSNGSFSFGFGGEGSFAVAGSSDGESVSGSLPSGSGSTSSISPGSRIVAAAEKLAKRYHENPLWGDDAREALEDGAGTRGGGGAAGYASVSRRAERERSAAAKGPANPETPSDASPSLSFSSPSLASSAREPAPLPASDDRREHLRGNTRDRMISRRERIRPSGGASAGSLARAPAPPTPARSFDFDFEFDAPRGPRSETPRAEERARRGRGEAGAEVAEVAEVTEVAEVASASTSVASASPASPRAQWRRGGVRPVGGALAALAASRGGASGSGLAVAGRSGATARRRAAASRRRRRCGSRR